MKTTATFHSCTMHLGKNYDKTTAITFFSHNFHIFHILKVLQFISNQNKEQYS